MTFPSKSPNEKPMLIEGFTEKTALLLRSPCYVSRRDRLSGQQHNGTDAHPVTDYEFPFWFSITASAGGNEVITGLSP